MQTQIIPIDEQSPDPGAVEEVCGILRRGGVVALPTETVYGLAANALDESAVQKIFAAKGRPQDNPLIVHIADIEMLPLLTRDVPPAARRLAQLYWPGPLTMVLPKSGRVPALTSAGLPTVGVRMPSHPVIRAVIRGCGFPLAAPSANRSGLPSTTTAEHCIQDLSGRVDAIVRSSPASVGVESTVVSLAADPPRLLRPGFITPEQLLQVLGELELDPAVTGPADPQSPAGAPGMKYRHYAPTARVRLVRGSSEAYCRYVNGEPPEEAAALCGSGEEGRLRIPALSLGKNAEEAARAVFGALREMDQRGVRTVYVHCPEPEGVGLAVFNRLQRAAAFEVIEV